MKLKKTLFILSVFGIAAAGANPALAMDDGVNVYPGSMCQTSTGLYNEYVNRANNASGNYSPDELDVHMVCPIIKTLQESTKPIKIYARIGSGNAEDTVCSTFSIAWDYSDINVGDSVAVGGSGVIKGVTIYGKPSFPTGTLAMGCTVPKGSQILNYMVFEY